MIIPVPIMTIEDSVSETVDWYLHNQEWVNHVKNGEYKKWIDEYYN